MKNNDKNIVISFIVPCYNVSNYIEECVNSIINQTEKSIEIILVNDGSKDSTLDKIKKLQNNDERIIVIDKENQGVSSARNDGIAVAKGEYIVFVDGDDYLSPKYSEYMLKLIKIDGADFALSKNCYTQKNESQIKKDKITKLTPAETAALLLSPVIKVGCWNKIYKRELLVKNKILFNPSLFYGEGLSFILKVSQLCNFAVVGEEKHYYYRRDNPNSACTTFDIEKVYNGEKSLKKIQSEFIINDEYMNEMMILHTCIYNAGARTKIRLNHVKKKYIKADKRWKKYNKQHLFKIITSSRVSLYRKLLIFASCYFINTLTILEKIRRRKIIRRSVS